MNKLFFIIIIGVTMFSCQRQRQGKPLSNYFGQKMTCQLKELDFPSDSIGKPDFIYSFDDYIILSEPLLDHLLSAYDISNKKFSRFLTKGNGPEELLDIQQIAHAKEENSFFVKSTFTKNFFTYISSNDSLMFQEKIPVPDGCVSSFWDENIIISSRYGDNRFSILDINNDTIKEFGTQINFNDYNQNIVSRILQGLCVGSSQKKRFAWFSIYGDAFEIYDYKNLDEIENIKQYIGITPIVSMEGGKPVFSPESKLGVSSLASNDDYIFALYNENTLSDVSTLRDEVFFSDKILVLDWDGNFIKVLELDNPVRSISYNREKNILFCVGYDKSLDYKVYYIEKAFLF